MNNSNAIINIRVIATIFIVFYHCCCPYTVWTYWGGYDPNSMAHDILYWFTLDFVFDCMLPTFFMLSGMVYFGRKDSYADRVKAIWKKVDRLLIPFAIMVCVQVLLGLSDPTGGHLWFVKVLFIYFVVTLLLYKVSEKWLLSFALVLYVGYIASQRMDNQLPEVVWRSLRYYIYFVLGHYANIYYKQLHSDIKTKLVVTLVAFVTLFFNNKVYSQFLYSIAFNAALLCYVSNRSVSNGIIQNLNRNSFAIYLFHHPIIVALSVSPLIHQLYVGNATLFIGCMFTLAFGSSWIISEGLHRIGFKYF